MTPFKIENWTITEAGIMWDGRPNVDYLIPKERLRAVPHTTQSIEAKLNQYRD